MKEQRDYKTIPGYLTVKQSTELLAELLGMDIKSDSVEANEQGGKLYRTVLQLARTGKVRWYPIGQSDRVKQISEQDLRAYALKTQGLVEEPDSIQECKEDVRIDEIKSILDMHERGYFQAEACLEAIKKVLEGDKQ